jgi:transaldolase
VQSVTKIYNYFKYFGYKTQVMGASFRNLGEITELAGCDLLTIAPSLLKELAERTGDLPRKLDPEKARRAPVERIVVDEASFRKMHASDAMANDKLAEGIAGFTDAIVKLEKYLGERLA